MRKGRIGQRYIFSTEFMTFDALFELLWRDYRPTEAAPLAVRQ